jgi:hypothetical protein
MDADGDAGVLMSVGVGDSGIDRQQLVLLNRVMFV